MKKPNKPKKIVHFVGIGGIGVSALAQYYRSEGWHVSGCDAARSEITDDLSAMGISVSIGHDSRHAKGVSLIIYSAAVKEDNPERVFAAKHGIPHVSYAEALGELTRRYRTIAVSGSHGKSTTTSLLGLVLLRAGLDPTIIVGTKLNNLGGANFRKGKSEYLVLEADEWNRSFHNYAPFMAVLTNIDKDHLDTYKSLKGVIAGFRTYLSNVVSGGIIVANWKDRNIRMLANAISRKKNVQVVFYNRTAFAKHSIRLPGFYNQVNAEAAWRAAEALGVKRSDAEGAFRDYQGAWRRLEEIAPGVFSDYAHHPTEIKATLLGLRERYPKSRLVCVFQPHQQERLTKLFSDFKTAFGSADKTIILPFYKVAGREQGKGKTSLDLVRAVNKKNVSYAETFNAALADAGSGSAGRDILVYMSAGNLDGEVRAHYRGAMKKQAR